MLIRSKELKWNVHVTNDASHPRRCLKDLASSSMASRDCAGPTVIQTACRHGLQHLGKCHRNKRFLLDPRAGGEDGSRGKVERDRFRSRIPALRRDPRPAHPPHDPGCPIRRATFRPIPSLLERNRLSIDPARATFKICYI